MKRDTKNGYFAIGILNPKTEMNVGSLWRSASIFNAAFIFTIGKRIIKQPSNTTKTHNSIPFYNYETFDDFYKNVPYDCQLIGVELDETSKPLVEYKHPKRCIYLLGAEDNGLTQKSRDKCKDIIELPNGNFNVANAGSIVMYDRFLKNNI